MSMIGDLDAEQLATGGETAEERQKDREHWEQAMPTAPKHETSKILLFAVLFISFAFDVVLVVGWFKGLDAGVMFGENQAAKIAVISFYSWKAKSENVWKYGPKLGYKAMRDAFMQMVKERADGRQDFNSFL